MSTRTAAAIPHRLKELAQSWWNARMGRAAATALVFVALVSLGGLSLNVVDELRRLKEAPNDNVQWSVLQVQTELLSAQIQAQKLEASALSTADSFRTAFDIFYSRVELLKSADIFATFRAQKFFATALDSLSASLEEMVPIVDAGPAEMIRQRRELSRRLAELQPTAQDLVVRSIAHFAVVSDSDRTRLMRLLANLALLAFLVFAGMVLVTMLLRRHADRLRLHADELQESEARLAATVRSALDGVIIADEHGTILDLNDQAASCFGYPRDRAIGANMAELIVPERMRAAHVQGMERFRATSESKIVGKRIEIDALHADGHEFPVELAIGVARRGASRLFIAYARDISQRRQDEARLKAAHEAAQAADKAKSRFLAIMSHEMRTPLNGILGVLQLLSEKRTEEEQLRLIAVAEESGDLLLGLINGVLDLSKLQANKIELDSVDFDISEILRAVRDIVAIDADGRGNQIRVRIEGDQPARVMGDPRRLRQVFLNLAANANKFTTGGTIDITAICVAAPDNTVHMDIIIADTGIGIPKDKIPLLFTEFTTLDSRYSRRHGGTGLGLAISKRIIDAMGGEIRVESEFGVGTRVSTRIVLPVAPLGVSRAPTFHHMASEPAAISPLRLLVAEDNPTNAMVARAMLEAAGHSVVMASNGDEAVAAVINQLFDLILMDISMPGMDGIEATRCIRGLNSPAATTPIVAMTADAMDESRNRALAAGMNDFLTKPIRRRELLRAIATNARGSVVQTSAPQSPVCGTIQTGPAEPSGAIDSEDLQHLADDVGPEMLGEIMLQFGVDVKERTRRTVLAAADIDGMDELAAAAHALAGCAATMGARRLADVSRKIEAAARQGLASAVALAPDLATLQAEALLAIAACDRMQTERVDISHATTLAGLR